MVGFFPLPEHLILNFCSWERICFVWFHRQEEVDRMVPVMEEKSLLRLYVTLTFLKHLSCPYPW